MNKKDVFSLLVIAIAILLIGVFGYNCARRIDRIEKRVEEVAESYSQSHKVCAICLKLGHTRDMLEGDAAKDTVVWDGEELRIARKDIIRDCWNYERIPPFFHKECFDKNFIVVTENKKVNIGVFKRKNNPDKKEAK